MNSLKDKVVVITGSGRGIGKAIAENVGLRGAKVILNGRTEETLMETRAFLSEKGIDCQYVRADASVIEESEKLIEEAIRYYGKIDILINNAGIAGRGLFEETKAETWAEIIRINTLGAIYPAIAALPSLKDTKGSIIFISTLAGMVGIPGSSTYSLSKMALTALSQAMEVELSSSDIHVGIVYVGFTKNHPDKKMLGGDGTMVKIGKRPAFLQMETEKVAAAVVSLIMKRKRSIVLSWLGKLQSFLFLFPFIRRAFMKITFRRFAEM
jgi:short-subunit dehydrogenase